MIDVEMLWSTDLTSAHYREMGRLFDSEYARDWGAWNPITGYGYAPLELHVFARMAGKLVGYAGASRRFISVGGTEVVVAGTGGVVTDPQCRGRGVGRSLLTTLQHSSHMCAPADFGLLGCREEVVAFYEGCGYTRINTVIRDISPRDGATVVESRGPTMICSGTRSAASWPEGVIDLRGLPW